MFEDAVDSSALTPRKTNRLTTPTDTDSCSESHLPQLVSINQAEVAFRDKVTPKQSPENVVRANVADRFGQKQKWAADEASLTFALIVLRPKSKLCKAAFLSVFPDCVNIISDLLTLNTTDVE